MYFRLIATIFYYLNIKELTVAQGRVASPSSPINQAFWISKLEVLSIFMRNF